MAVGKMPRIDFNLIISRWQTTGRVELYSDMRDYVSNEI